MRPSDFEVIRFKIRGSGSLEHFYHFILGALIPFANHLATTERRELYFIRSCGPMNRHWLSLNLGNVVLVDKDTLEPLSKVFPDVELNGFNAPDHFNAEAFARGCSFIAKTFATPLSAADTRGHVALIDRGKGDAYYDSSLSEKPGSADTRRSIPNIDDVASAIRNAGYSVAVHRLETASMEEQARIFSSAEIVVAQHGAALANVIWMKSGARAIEILPKALAAKAAVFRRLAETCGLHYAVLEQDSDHAPVDPAAIVAAIARMQQRQTVLALP